MMSTTNREIMNFRVELYYNEVGRFCMKNNAIKFIAPFPEHFIRGFSLHGIP